MSFEGAFVFGLGELEFGFGDDRVGLELALFTGALHLWSDTTLWKWIYGQSVTSATAFYQATVARIAGRSGSQGRFSLDDHVVPSFSKLKPRRLGKTRVPTRGRSYPAFRLYAPFDLDLGRFVGVIARKARESLSQVVPLCWRNCGVCVIRRGSPTQTRSG